jgi:serine/threonine-protein kinase
MAPEKKFTGEAERARPRCEDLAAYLEGKLPEDFLEAVAAHALACARCAHFLETLDDSDNALIAGIQSGGGESPFLEEPEYAKLLARARALAPETSCRSTATPRPDATGLAPPEPEESWPVAFGKYQLLGRLGRGGMGVVYKACQNEIKLLVAVKTILAGSHAGPQVLERFRVEGQSLARLNHPNVVKVYDFGTEGGVPYFSLELVEGGSLADRLRGKPWPPNQAARLVQTVAKAIHAAHQCGIVHRDLKPSNILLTADGTPKVTDFGLAKLLDSPDGQTESGQILGTDKYMAPEQAQGKVSAVGPAADVYALGAILYEALTGRPPFVGTTKLETLAQVVHQEPVPPSHLERSISRDLEAICLKCLEKEPGRRYLSAQALAEDLGFWLDHKTPRVRPRRWPVRIGRSCWRFGKRHPLVSVSPLIAGLVVLLVLLAVTSNPPEGSGQRGKGKPPPDPDRVLKAIQNQLARGKAATLIGETGEPRWSQWVLGEGAAKVSPAADGTYTVHTWALSMLELVQDPQKDRYRFQAEVRHRTSDESGEVGIYFAREQHPGAASTLHSFCQLTFNDVRDVLQLHRLAERLTGKPLPPSPGNQVFFLPRFCAEGKKGLWDPRLSGPNTTIRFFKAAGLGGGPWRKLRVEVTPAKVRAWWGKRKNAGEWEVPQLVRAIGRELQERQKQPRERAFLRGTKPGFSCRGALGLYVLRGSASFRNVKVEPLDNPN